MEISKYASVVMAVTLLLLGNLPSQTWAQSPTSSPTTFPTTSPTSSTPSTPSADRNTILPNTTTDQPSPVLPHHSISTGSSAKPPQHTQPSRVTPHSEWQPPAVPPEYSRYQYQHTRPSAWLRLFYWLIYSLWFWVILAVLVLPYLSVWWTRRQKMQRFLRARMAELANPIDAGARFQLGHTLFKQGKYKRALGYLRQAHQIQQEQDCLDPRLLDALADTLLALGQREEAIALYKQSLSMDETGGQGDVFVQLGRAYQEKKEFTTAESWLVKACEANRSLAEPVYRLALHLHDQKQSTQARKIIDEFLIDAHALPNFIRRRNRRWVWFMRIFPLGRWFA